MDYITERAHRIFELAHGGGVPTGGEKGDYPLYRMYAVLSFAKGNATTARDVHDVWSAWMAGVYPQHRSLKPFDQLDADIQRADDPYVDAIHKASEEP